MATSTDEKLAEAIHELGRDVASFRAEVTREFQVLADFRGAVRTDLRWIKGIGAALLLTAFSFAGYVIADLSSLKTEVRGQGRRLDEAAAEVKRHGERLGKVEGRLDRVEGRLDGLDRKLDAVLSRLPVPAPLPPKSAAAPTPEEKALVDFVRDEEDFDRLAEKARPLSRPPAADHGNTPGTGSRPRSRPLGVERFARSQGWEGPREEAR